MNKPLSAICKSWNLFHCPLCQVLECSGDIAGGVWANVVAMARSYTALMLWKLSFRVWNITPIVGKTHFFNWHWTSELVFFPLSQCVVVLFNHFLSIYKSISPHWAFLFCDQLIVCEMSPSGLIMGMEKTEFMLTLASDSSRAVTFTWKCKFSSNQLYLQSKNINTDFFSITDSVEIFR